VLDANPEMDGDTTAESPGDAPLRPDRDLQGRVGPGVRARPAIQAGGSGPSDAFRRIAAELSGAQDLETLFEEVLDDAAGLFTADRAALLLLEPHDGRAYRIAGERQLPDALRDWIATIGPGDDTPGLVALDERDVRVVETAAISTSESPGNIFRELGIESACFVPVVFRGSPLGLIALYHEAAYDWNDDRRALARGLGDSLAAAIGNGRLARSVESMAGRLRSIQDLAARLNRIQDVPGIGAAIVAEVGTIIAVDTIRVYRVDHASGWCEPIAFRGRFMGTENPTDEMLRVEIGEGLTGWVAAHGESIRLGNAHDDERSVIVGKTTGPESMLVVPMAYEDQVHGVLVASRLGLDHFDGDDETTFAIFAGYAAQALVNAMRVEQLREKESALERHLSSQRQLAAVNERLLSTLDPAGVLELIADSLHSVVAYDSLTIYRVDRARGVRRPVIARDQFAEVILDFEAPLFTGISGWAVDHAEAVLANDAQHDPRSLQIPGTPFEPESMIVVPLIVEGEILGTLNISRMGEAESHFSDGEFELTKLFAAQAAIALRNAEAHGAVKTQAERDALTELRNHGAFQRELGAAIETGPAPIALLMMDLDRFKSYNDTHGHPAGDGLLVKIARALEGAVRADDRVYRYGGDEFAAVLRGAGRADAQRVAERVRAAVDAVEAPDPRISVSIGVAAWPEDGSTKDAVVEAADHALYVAKGSRAGGPSRDPFVAALNETAAALFAGTSSDALLESILARSTHLLGTDHGYIYTPEPNGRELVVRLGTGLFAELVGYRLAIGTGLAGQVFQSGRALAVPDYGAFTARAADLPAERFGSVVGIPLTAGDERIGVLGLASGSPERIFGDREIEVLSRFAQLASIALANARLQEAAHRGTRHDATTSLPNREVLVDRISRALAANPESANPVAVMLMDLDRFKVVNEAVGHEAGDRVLHDVGQRLLSAVRGGDVVARFSGDQFAILLSRGGDRESVRAAAKRILSALKAPFTTDGRAWFISASMGIAIGEPGRTSAGEILREAEIALVQAKGEPTRRFAIHDPSMSEATLERVELESALRLAVGRGEIRVHYQPIVDLRTGRTASFEALVRWQHPTRGLVPPASFIPMAEETGLIISLGRHVLDVACEQLASWRRRWPERNLTMSVNLSARQLRDPGLAEAVRAALRRTHLPPDALQLELTESAVMDQSTGGPETLRSLRALDVRLGLDDFGTGYSSLSYLRELPLNQVKIDRSFVVEIPRDEANAAIVRAVVNLAHALGFEVVAEGVEESSQLETLRSLGVDLIQGYLLARPADAATITDFVDAESPTASPGRGPARARSRRAAGSPAEPAISGGRRRAGAGTGRG
jgi:diguanylate cyclase (GGDEF)-like protein